ncbi:MAG: GAF domain-containing protein [Xenococcaceae cyanobacterium]
MAKNFFPRFNGNKVSSEQTLVTQSAEETKIKPEVEQKSNSNQQNLQPRNSRIKIIAKILAISIIPLAVLTSTISTYYNENQFFEQTYDNSQVEESKPHLILTILLICAGTASGALTALLITRVLLSAETSKKEVAKKQLVQKIKTLTKTIDRLRGETNPEDILQTAVEITRTAIECDRVIIYSLDKQSQGKVVTESVDSRFPQALNSVIEDPCFNSHYLDKYQNGRVRAINDIERAELTPCHISQLKPLAVKASLVSSIIHQGQLRGLLIAHHCAAPHNWQESEIEMSVHIAKQIGLVLDHYSLLNELILLRKEKQTEINRIESLTNATRQIRASFSEEAVFQTAVEEARKAIECDRVLVYSLDKQSQGKVIAESVDSRFPQSLGKVIDDPCFSRFYIEKYKNGRVKATDDIYNANLTPCHLAQLEPFAVKANLVTPIVNHDKIFGLLIAHQCSASHAWQPSEIDALVQIANQTGSTIDYLRQLLTSNNLQQEKETEIKRVHSLTNAVEKICTSVKPKDIFQTGVEEARKALECDRVLVYSLDEQSQGKVIAESVEPQFPQALGAIVDDPCFSNYYIEKYQNGRVKATDDIYRAGLTACHLSQLEPFAVKANLVSPIIHQNKLIGLLIAHYCAAPHNWQQSEIDVIVQISKQIGFAIESFNLLTEVAQISQAFMEQIPAVADFAQVAIANARQAQIQVQQTSQTIKAGCEVANQTVGDLADIQDNIARTVNKIKYLGKSSQKISQLVAVIDNLATQINIQGMNILIRASQTGKPADGSPTAPLTETIESLREELATATSEIQSFVSKIETEVEELSTTMKNKTEKVVRGADLVEETRQKLNQIDTVTDKMSVLLGKIINAAAKGVQTSASNRQAIIGQSNLLPQNRSQPDLVNDSLNKLIETYLQVENSLPPQQEDSQDAAEELRDNH